MTASVISLEVYRDRQAEQTFRSRVHQSVDAFLDRWEARMASQEASWPSLLSLTEAVRQERAALTGAMVGAYVEKGYGGYLHQEYAPCPVCGVLVKARPARSRTVETLIGRITLQRPYFYCAACAKGFYPLDEALRLSPDTKQYDVQQAATELALEMPYEEAARLLGKWTDARMSDGSLHGVVNAVGADLGALEVCPTAEEIHARIEEVSVKGKWKPIMVLAMDGADVPTRPERAKGKRPGRKKVRARRARWEGEYRQAKGFRLFLVDEDRIVHLISWHQIQTEEEMGNALRQIKQAGLIPEEKVRLCVVADGDPWIWKWVEQLFPSARQILDFYHCSSYFHQIAQTQYAADPLRARQWLEATMARLFCNEGAGVIWGLQRMKSISEEAQNAIAKALTYLSKRLHQIAYGSHRKGGYPIGSGAIESAHRFICHVRLKRSGAWWYQENSNHMLALRCAKYNGTWEQVFQRYIHSFHPNISNTAS